MRFLPRTDDKPTLNELDSAVHLAIHSPGQSPFRPTSGSTRQLANALNRRLQWLTWLLGLPLLGLVLALAWQQAQQEQALALRQLESRVMADAGRLMPLARETQALVLQWQLALQRRLAPEEATGMEVGAGQMATSLSGATPPTAAPHSSSSPVRSPIHTRLGSTSGTSLQTALQAWPAGVAREQRGWSLDALGPVQRERTGQVLSFAPDAQPPGETTLAAAEVFLEQVGLAQAGRATLSHAWLQLADEALWAAYPFVPAAVALQAAGHTTLADLREHHQFQMRRASQWRAEHPGQTLVWHGPMRARGGAGLQAGLDGLLLRQDRVVGQVGVEIEIPALQRAVAAMAAGHGGRWWLVDTQRFGLLADSQNPLPAEAPGVSGDNFHVPLADRLPAGTPLAQVQQALARSGTALLAGQQVLVVQPLAPSPWALVVMQSQSQLRQQVWSQVLPFGLLFLTLLLMMAIAHWLFRREILRPALEVMAYGQALADDPQAPAPDLPPRWAPWISGISGLVQSRSALARSQHRSEAFKAAVVDNALAAVVITDPQGRVVDWNPAAERIFGRTRQQAIGQPVGDLIIPPRLRAGHEQGLRRLREGARPQVTGQRMELPALRADGSEFPVEMVLARIEVDGDGHYCAFISDLSERESARQQIERQREALRQSEKLGAMGSLLAGVAHELNNPLAIVMGRAGLLEEKAHQPELQHDARLIREAAQRCGRIVRTFLNMARSRPPQRREVALNEVVLAATDMLAYTLRSHGILLDLALAPELPVLNADADQLGQVVLNLLVNAQQALQSLPTPAPGQPLPDRKIQVATGLEARRSTREQRLWLRVSDNGPGVRPELRERIFEPFYTSKSEGSGTGLGLSMSRAIVREHGGDLRLEAGFAGPGACFRLSMPPATPISDDSPWAQLGGAGEGRPAPSAADRALVPPLPIDGDTVTGEVPARPMLFPAPAPAKSSPARVAVEPAEPAEPAESTASGQAEATHSASPQTVASTRASPAESKSSVDFSQTRMLVVDDEPQLLAMLRDTLEAAGVEVFSAECGEVALEMLAELRVDAIVSDLHMPQGDGAALWAGIQSRFPAMRQRVLFVTGDILSPHVASFLASTGRPALEKPFQPAELLARLRDIVA